MNGNISFLFDFWADLVVHLLLLKSIMPKVIKNIFCPIDGMSFLMGYTFVLLISI